MAWPFLYVAGDVLSDAELRAARLDGDVVEVGDAFMPADAIETRELRAASLRPLTGDRLAVTHETAAWVHGALPDPPTRHCVQRCTASRVTVVPRHRLRYRDLALPERDALLIAGVPVTTLERTVVDLLRDRVLRGEGGDELVRAMLHATPTLAAAALAWLESSGPVHRKRGARDYLRAYGQEVVTR